MTRDIILKRYERGMKPAEIAACENLELSHVEEVISSSGIQPVKRKKVKPNTTLITDDEIKRRLEEGETRYAIEKDFNLTTGALMNRVKRIQAEQGGQSEPKVRGRKPKVSDEHLIEYVNSGKTCIEIARIMKTSHTNMKNRLERIGIFEMAEQNKDLKKEGSQPRVFVSIDFELVEKLLRKGLTLPQIATELGIKYNTLLKRMKRKPELKELANRTAKELSRRQIEEINAAKRELAVTTDAIAEARNTAKDKWVHYVAHQIDNARIKTKFDVVEQDGKLIKQTEVRFVIEEELA